LQKLSFYISWVPEALLLLPTGLQVFQCIISISVKIPGCPQLFWGYLFNRWWAD